MSEPTIRPAVLADAAKIKLRDCDLREALDWAPWVTPEALIKASILNSEQAYTALDGDEVVAIGGYSIQDGNLLSPWLVASDLLDKHKRKLMRTSRAFLKAARECHPGRLTYNYVARDNDKARAYLKALGFTIVHGPAGSKFDFFFLPDVR